MYPSFLDEFEDILFVSESKILHKITVPNFAEKQTTAGP
jgi:hypothetical protein